MEDVQQSWKCSDTLILRIWRAGETTISLHILREIYFEYTREYTAL